MKTYVLLFSFLCYSAFGIAQTTAHFNINNQEVSSEYETQCFNDGPLILNNTSEGPITVYKIDITNENSVLVYSTGYVTGSLPEETNLFNMCEGLSSGCYSLTNTTTGIFNVTLWTSDCCSTDISASTFTGKINLANKLTSYGSLYVMNATHVLIFPPSEPSYWAYRLDDNTCNKQLATFTYPSQRKIRDYLDCSNPGTWDIDCKLYDVTTSSYVLVDRAHLSGVDANGGGPGCTTLNEYAVVTSINSDHNAHHIVVAGDYMQFNFNNVLVQEGHTYRVNLRITCHYLSSNILLADESSETSVVWASPYAANTWNHDIFQPSFTSVATGTIAGNFGGNNEAYMIGTDNRLYNVVWSGNQWNIWCIDNTFTNAAPGGICVNPGNGQVYFIGTDHRVYNAYWSLGSWHIYALDNTFTNAAYGAITVDQGNGHVYFIGLDNKVYNACWDNTLGIWHIWVLNGFSNAAPGAISVVAGTGHVYFIGLDNMVYNACWDNTAGVWNTWVLNSFAGAAPGAISADAVTSHVYFVGLDHKLYNYVWDATTGWNAYALTSFNGAAYGAIIDHPTSGHIYFIGTDNRVYNAYWDGTTWNVYNLDGGYTSSTPGSIGVLVKHKSLETEDMVFDVDNANQLDVHIWPSCAESKPAALAPSSQSQVIPADFIMTPNPMTSETSVSFDNKTMSDVSLALYTVTGQKVKDIVHQNLSRGHYNYTISRNDLSAGIYFVVFETNNQRKTSKLIIE